MESIFGVRKFGHSFELCQIITFPADFISDVVDLLPKIVNHFNEVTKELARIIENSSNSDIDEDSDAEGFTSDLFSDEANLIKVCFGLCIRLLAALFTWPEFSDDANKEILNSRLN